MIQSRTLGTIIKWPGLGHALASANLLMNIPIQNPSMGQTQAQRELSGFYIFHEFRCAKRLDIGQIVPNGL